MEEEGIQNREEGGLLLLLEYVASWHEVAVEEVMVGC